MQVGDETRTNGSLRKEHGKSDYVLDSIGLGATRSDRLAVIVQVRIKYTHFRLVFPIEEKGAARHGLRSGMFGSLLIRVVRCGFAEVADVNCMHVR